MNISRNAYVRPAVVAVIAMTVAGCSLLSPAEPAREQTASTVAQAPAPEAVVDQALDADDDDDEVVEPQADQFYESPGGAVPLESDWSQPFYVQYAERGPLERPVMPTRVIGLLPESSQLRVDSAQLTTQAQAVLASPDVTSAVQIAQATLLGFTHLVNDRVLEPFSSVAATTCSFCMYRLEAAYAVHDEQAELPAPWEITLEAGAGVEELSWPDHLLVEFTGEDKGLILRIDDAPVMVDLPGQGRFLVEMVFAQEQWWVLEVYGPAATAQPPSN